MHDVLFKLLKKLPEYDKSIIYETVELDTDYSCQVEDKYHVVLRERSYYAAMDDIKAWVKKKYPDADLSCFGVSYHNFAFDGSEGITVNTNDGQHIVVSGNDVVKHLKKEHIHEHVYCDCIKDWSFEVGYEDAQWLKQLLSQYPEGQPVYVDDKFVKQALRLHRERYRTMDLEELEGKLECFSDSYDKHPVVDALCMGYALSKRYRNCILMLVLD